MPLIEFFDRFESAFRPPEPDRGARGRGWFISHVWSEYMKAWLLDYYRVELERRLLPSRLRLDAALRTKGSDDPRVRIALEWEWDNNKVHRNYPRGDFVKILETEADCGIAIIQTRVDGRRGNAQAEQTLAKLKDVLASRRRDDRQVGLIECRRTECSPLHVVFDCRLVDLSHGTPGRTRRLQFPASS